MNFYRRFPGDYARDTRHLTLLEHGAYAILLDIIYSTERPLPRDQKAIRRLSGCRTPEESEAVDRVLQEFFTRTRWGWIQKRAAEEIKRYKSKVSHLSENGRKGGRPQKEKQAEKQKLFPDESIQKAFQSENQNQRGKSQIQNQKPSQDHVSVAAVERGKLAAAAFTDLGFEKPFGRPNFQALWVTHYMQAVDAGGWITQAMEDTIQECQKAGIGIPPQFYDAKHDVEKRESASVKKVPL